MPVVTLRPNSNPFPPGTWIYLVTGSGSVEGATSDNSDSSYVNMNAFAGTNHTLDLDLTTFAFPSGTVINSVTPRMRYSTSSGGSSLNFGIEDSGGNGWTDPAPVNTSISTITGTARTTKPTGGAWTQADIDGLRVYVATAPNDRFIYELYVDVDYTTHQNPSVPTGLSVTSAETTTTPSFQATVSDPDGNQVKARFEVYDNAGTTLLGTVDSSFVNSGNAASATYGSALAIGQYKVRVKAIDNEAMESAFTSMISFQVVTAVNKDLGLLWNVADPTTPVSKDLGLLWNVMQNNVKDMALLWDVQVVAAKDLILRWNVLTPWTSVPEGATTWTEVGEG